MSAQGSSSVTFNCNSKDYKTKIATAIDYAKTHRDTAVLMAFDIDDTIKRSSGTGGITKAPQAVIDALSLIHGANSSVFVLLATGRNPQDADAAFPRLQLPLIAKDGSWIHFPAVAGQHDAPVRYSFPECEAFKAKALDILENYKHVSELALGDAIGLRYDRTQSGSEYGRHLAFFKNLASKRTDIPIDDHTYDNTIKIIIQNGKHSKATGIEKVIPHLKSNFGFKKVVLFTHGNSSNDINMLKLANSLKTKAHNQLG